MKLRVGDTVKVRRGKDKGKTGQIIKTLPKQQQVIVTGVNQVKKHIRQQAGTKGGILEVERPILVSKLSLICPSCDQPVRVGWRIGKKGVKQRLCRRCAALIDTVKTSKKSKKKKTK